TVDFGQPILHVSGLDNFAPPRPNSRPKPAAQNLDAAGKTASNAGSGPSGSYAGNDFRNAYLPGVPLTGTGQSVGLLEFDGYYAGDITAYETQFGLPNVPLINVLIDGGVPIPGSGNGEVCLDIEMVIALSPGVSAIYVYESSGSWVNMLNRMVTDNVAKQLSCSWYIPNGGANPGVEVIFQQMAAQGQSFFAASGDSDAYTGLIPFPCDSPSITQVGGTTLTTSGPGGSFVSETVWNWGGGVGGSGGVSTNYNLPAWQQGISMANNLGSTTMRNVPDVAWTADNIWVTYDNGGSGSFGGTSCAAPLWAAFMALVNQQAAANGQPPLGFLNPTLYSIGKGASYATNFHDTTTGNNFSSSSPNKFPATAGFDLATGWGSPTAAMLITLSTPPDALLVSGTDLTTSGPAGGPFTPSSTTYTLKNSGVSSLNWTMSSTQSWLTVFPSSGTLAAGATATVTVSPNSEANALGVGVATSTLNVVDTTSGITQTRPATLTVLGPPNMTVSPAGSLSFRGNVGGPFTPASVTYTITNTGAPSMTWAASNTSGWLSLSSSGGTLAAGASTTITASPAAAANNLPLGSYSDTITFTNTTNGAGNTAKSATLDVVNEVQVPLPPQTTTFAGLTRGYWFTAPTTFILTAVQVPTDASTGAQSIAVLKLNAAPPTYPSTTNTFTTLFLTQNNPSTGIIPVNIQINQGDVIGLLGWRGGANSYGTAPYSTQILGQNVTFSRFGMQYSLDSTLPQSVWTDTSTGSLSRVFMYVSGTTNVPIITSPYTASVPVGQPFGYQILATNNPTSYSATALPTGLSIDTTTGIISGTPTTVGTTPVTISATNGNGTGSATLTISVTPAPPVITSTLNASGSTGTAFSYQITATKNPVSFSATGLPGGLTINTSTGLINGTPTTGGTSNVTISATNAGGTGSATLVLTISLSAPRITSSLSSSVQINTAFSYS
ncbi:MAG TPA: putative Ig domain-containing protein, partial [Roseimicrobium sp.]|nr:putative Ig domain-containing protein [Roseimicrobium sp.]